MIISSRKMFARIYKLMSNRLLVNTVLGCVLVEYVECKHCTYTYESGLRSFYCSAYEYCCGPLCCRSRSIGFFQLWYFWLMIILMLMLCSGGGWWYKFRYRNHYRQGMPNFGMSGNPSGFRTFTYSAGGQPASQPAPAPFTAGTVPSYPTYPSNSYPYPPMGATPLYPQGGPYPMMGTPYPTQPKPMDPMQMPPPAYTGPPPSYAAATSGTNTS